MLVYQRVDQVCLDRLALWPIFSDLSCDCPVTATRTMMTTTTMVMTGEQCSKPLLDNKYMGLHSTT